VFAMQFCELSGLGACTSDFVATRISFVFSFLLAEWPNKDVTATVMSTDFLKHTFTIP